MAHWEVTEIFHVRVLVGLDLVVGDEDQSVSGYIF